MEQLQDELLALMIIFSEMKHQPNKNKSSSKQI